MTLFHYVVSTTYNSFDATNIGIFFLNTKGII